ncbi:MAG TPA: hypothetical protein VGB76_17880 [Pyrinomonadaceae bacterium]|jgi:hypothetical protein
MDRTRQLLFILLLLVGWSFSGALTGKLLSVPQTRAEETEQSNAGMKWEYCALSKAAYAGSARGGIYWISYFQETGVQVVEVQASVTEGNGAAMAKAISKLGSEGWEMVAPAPLEVNQVSTTALYFKRPKAAAR